MKTQKKLALLLALLLLTQTLCTTALAANTGAQQASGKTTPTAAPQTPAAGNAEKEVPKPLTADLPSYLLRAYEFVNNGHPAFTEQELTSAKGTQYSEQDTLKRSGICTALIGPETVQKDDRKDQDTKNPSGWQSVLFEGSKTEYLYERTRLIGWKLDGAKEDLRNLVTGTAAFANEGMAVIETVVADYVEKTGNHVLYRATPVYTGNNLLADGVLIEAESVEDKGEGLLLCVYCYNIQPGVEIDYATGKPVSTKVEKINSLDALTGAAAAAITGGRSASGTEAQKQADKEEGQNDGDKSASGTTDGQDSKSSSEESVTSSSDDTAASDVITYVGNKGTKKFHYPNCKSVSQMKEKNKVFFYGDRSEPISQGYDPCGNCHP